MRSIREILRLHWSCEQAGRKIALALGISRSAVWECLRRARAANLKWPLPETLSDEDLELLLYPTLNVEEKNARPLPNFEYIFKEKKKKGVTLSLLWAEYKQANPTGYEYTQFTELFRTWAEQRNLVMRQVHKAGDKAFSDFSGGTLLITDPRSGEKKAAKLFVSTLGASNYTYAELFFGETAEAWCTGQANAFTHFGGCPTVIVPDNPRATVSKADRYEPEINADFLHMAEHFGVAVIPARVRKPKDKAKVEAAVGLATRWILAALRNQVYFSLAEANQAVKLLLEKLNNRPFQKMSGSRSTLFETVDKPALKSLPLDAYEYAHVLYAKVDLDYHVQIDDGHYSVPHKFVGQKVEVRVSNKTVEAFASRKRIASHVRLQGLNKCSTLLEHMPKDHLAYRERGAEQFLQWAEKLGKGTTEIVSQILTRRQHPEQAFRACQGVQRLAKEYGNPRLEAACVLAVTLKTYTCKNLRLILSNNMDSRMPAKEEVPQLAVVHCNIRGKGYFGQEEEIQRC